MRIKTIFGLLFGLFAFPLACPALAHPGSASVAAPNPIVFKKSRLFIKLLFILQNYPFSNCRYYTPYEPVYQANRFREG